MTTTAQPRIAPGVPSGGEFTSFGHSDNVPALFTPLNVHEQTHLGLMSDSLDSRSEVQACRDAVVRSLIGGDFGSDTEQVSALLEDERLVRLAVDRYVVNETQAPGTHNPDQSGQVLGRYLIEMANEDEETAAGWAEAGE